MTKRPHGANKALREQPNFPAANRILAALAGHMNEAQEAMAHLRQLDPSLRVSNLTEAFPLRHRKISLGLPKACERLGSPSKG
jgi:adenylate cyclase